MQDGGIRNEFNTLKAIGKHKHIIEYKEFGSKAERIQNINGGQIDQVEYLALELAHNKTILDFLLSKRDSIGEKWTRLWFRQILSALKHMKEKEFSHLDLKSENILLDKNLLAKIADFGLSQPNGSGISKVTGSEFHKAPEICYRQYPYSGEKADIFSLGVVLFAMNMRAFPFERVNDVINSRKYKHFLEGNLAKFWPADPSTSPEFK